MFRRRSSQPSESVPGVQLVPIGLVINEIEDRDPRDVSGVRSLIEVREEYAGMLDGLEGFSHVIVVAYAHLVPPHIPDRDTLPLEDGEVGLFATRVVARPNHLMVSVVPLLERDGRRLSVLGLDAVNGTPVLDLKPYLPRYDAVPDATLPDWAK